MSTAEVAATLRGARRGIATWADRHIRWTLVAPVVILILLVFIFPLGYSLWLSFVQFDFRVEGASLERLPELHTGDQERGCPGEPVADGRARRGRGGGRARARTAARPRNGEAVQGPPVPDPIFILPLFMAPVVVGQIWRLLWDTQLVRVNYILSLIWPGDVEIIWSIQSPWNWISIVVTDAWQWTPFMFVILLAGLVAISEDVYEAAALDGASRWQTFREVTFPPLLPVMIVAVAFRLIDALRIFDIIYALTGGGPGTSTYTASLFLYEQGFTLFNFGEASAGSWMFLVVISFIAYWLVRRLMTAEPV